MSKIDQAEFNKIMGEYDKFMSELAEKQVHPKCHFTYMEYVCADDGDRQVEYWECKHCTHTKEIR